MAARAFFSAQVAAIDGAHSPACTIVDPNGVSVKR